MISQWYQTTIDFDFYPTSFRRVPLAHSKETRARGKRNRNIQIAPPVHGFMKRLRQCCIDFKEKNARKLLITLCRVMKQILKRCDFFVEVSGSWKWLLAV